MSDDFLRERLHYHWQHLIGGLPSDRWLQAVVQACSLAADPPPALWRTLPPAEAEVMILALKEEADRQTRIGWEGSLARAEQILTIGTVRGDLAIQALGTMAKGDALKLVMGRLEEAWELLEAAGTLYQRANLPEAAREIGWARTRIGRLYLCVELARTEQGYSDAEAARAILEQYGCWDRLISLNVAWGSAYINDYRYRDAMTPLAHARDLARRFTEAGEPFLSAIYNNLAVAARGVGEQDEALRHFREVEQVADSRGELLAWAVARLNGALIQMDRGNYRVALRHLLEVEPVLEARYSKGWVHVVFNLVECYIALNRLDQARAVGLPLLDRMPSPLSVHQYSQLCLWLAQGEVQSGMYTAAQALLTRARGMLGAGGSPTVLVQLELEEAHAALLQGQVGEARQRIEAIVPQVEAGDAVEVRLRALLVACQAARQDNDPETAFGYARRARRLAHRLHFAPYEYEAYLQLGMLSEAEGQFARARSQYARALVTLARVYRGLSFTLHADFLSTRRSGFQRLMHLELAEARGTQAFMLLEQGKNYLFWDYLQRSNRLRWRDTPESRAWQRELAGCRTDYRRIVEALREGTPHVQSLPLRDLEHRIRFLTERLYLYGAEAQERIGALPTPAAIQAALPAGSVLLEFYEAADRFWLFWLSANTLEVYPLSASPAQIRTLIAQVRENTHLTCQTVLPGDWQAPLLAKKSRQLYTRLAEALLEPVKGRIAEQERLYIVPYGPLHGVPFHLLRPDGAYLIEAREVVVLPTAAFLTRQRPVCPPRYRWVGYSGGTLPQTVQEATTLHARWGGELYLEAAAQWASVARDPCQVVHIATHGVHGVDHYFDQSFLQLAEGEVRSDDILQQSLVCELVTFSVCDSGVVTVAPGEELLGLGRALLYAGAGSLVTSLWQVRDEVSADLMPRFYANLMQGASKAAALRGAMLEVLAQDLGAHPAYWGAFQLVGDAGALSGEGISYQHTDQLPAVV